MTAGLRRRPLHRGYTVGAVRGIAGVRVGDRVSAQITGSPAASADPDRDRDPGSGPYPGMPY
jgi:hypothetical protein